MTTFKGVAAVGGLIGASRAKEDRIAKQKLNAKVGKIRTVVRSMTNVAAMSLVQGVIIASLSTTTTTTQDYPSFSIFFRPSAPLSLIDPTSSPS